jgi:hypothetical protein
MSQANAMVHHEIVDVTDVERRPEVLMVVANSSVSTTTGWPVGLWAAELFHPYYLFSKKRYAIEGKAMTGFANVEEDFVDAAVGQTVMPFRIEDEAKARGANFMQAGLFKPFAVRDQNLITGQQQYSGEKVAQAVIEALGD